MPSKSHLYGLLGIVLGAMLTTPVAAKVCGARSASGVCLFWIGSFVCEDLLATGVQAGQNVSCNGEAIENLDSGQFEFVTACSNSGGNIAIGNQTVTAQISAGSLVRIQPADIEKNGKVVIPSISTELDRLLLEKLAADTSVAFTWEDLYALDAQCKNGAGNGNGSDNDENWELYKFAFVDVLAEVSVCDWVDGDPGQCVPDKNQTAFYECTLPNSEIVGWDSSKDTFVNKDTGERVQYDCLLISN